MNISAVASFDQRKKSSKVIWCVIKITLFLEVDFSCEQFSNSYDTVDIVLALFCLSNAAWIFFMAKTDIYLETLKALSLTHGANQSCLNSHILFRFQQVLLWVVCHFSIFEFFGLWAKLWCIWITVAIFKNDGKISFDSLKWDDLSRILIHEIKINSSAFRSSFSIFFKLIASERILVGVQ